MPRDYARTVQEVLDLVDDVIPNSFTPEVKTKWLAELDGLLATEVMLMADVAEFMYTYPDRADYNLIVKYPYDGIYETWLRAKIEFANGEYEKYNNSMEMYNAQKRAFSVWFINTYRPGQGYVERVWHRHRVREDIDEYE